MMQVNQIMLHADPKIAAQQLYPSSERGITRNMRKEKLVFNVGVYQPLKPLLSISIDTIKRYSTGSCQLLPGRALFHFFAFFPTVLLMLPPTLFCVELFPAHCKQNQFTHIGLNLLSTKQNKNICRWDLSDKCFCSICDLPQKRHHIQKQICS